MRVLARVPLSNSGAAGQLDARCGHGCPGLGAWLNAASLSPAAVCQPVWVTFGLRTGWVGSRGRWRGERVPAGAGLGEEAVACPFGELGEHVPGPDAEVVGEFAAGPVASGFPGRDLGDLVASGIGRGLAGMRLGRVVLRARGRAAGRSGGGTRMEVRQVIEADPRAARTPQRHRRR
jgi:hypothetical protein